MALAGKQTRTSLGDCFGEKTRKYTMASLKAEKPIGTQLFGQVKKDSAKPSDGDSKAPAASKPASKKTAPKPQETKKKKARGGKSASK